MLVMERLILNLDFLLRYGKVETTLNFILHHDMSKKLFCETLLNYCIHFNLVDYLLSLFKSMDFKICIPWLLYSCKYLSDEKKLKNLLKIQEFMSDKARSGLTCIRLFIHSTQFTKKIYYLELAIQHFLSSLDQIQNGEMFEYTKTQVLKPDEIKKYLNSIHLQIEVTKSFQKRKEEKEEGELNLFGSLKKKNEIILKLFHFNSLLSIRLINEYKLSLVKIALDFIKSNSKETKLIHDILKNLNNYLNDRDWDYLLFSFINFLSQESLDNQSAMQFIPMLKSSINRVQGYLVCGEFKKAYFSALKSNSVKEMSLVMAKATDSTTSEGKEVFELSRIYLKQNAF
jgi:hypothetical protein